MFKRRKQAAEPARQDQVMLVPAGSGLSVFGSQSAVDEFVSGMTSAVPYRRPAARTLLDLAQVASTVGGLSAATGEFVQLSPETMRQLAASGATPSSSAGYFQGVVRRADGSIQSMIDWKPVDLAPQQMLVLQQAATMAALRMAVQEVTEAIARVEGKLDVLSDLVRSQRVGNALGDFRFLSALAERVESGSSLTATDWSTVEHLGAEITRDIEGLRGFVRMRLADEQDRRSTRSRADRLEALAASHLDEMLGALLLCEHNLLTWERLKLARFAHAETDQLEPVMQAAQQALTAHRDEDQRLVTDLEREIDDLSQVRGLEGLAPISRNHLLDYAAQLNAAVDWFADQRTLDVTDFEIDLPGSMDSLRELKTRATKTTRSATSAVTSRVRRGEPSDTPALDPGDQPDIDE